MRLGNPIIVRRNVFQVRAVGARVTAIVSESGFLLVDAGSRGSLPFIKGGLNALNLSLDGLASVVVTHHHPDHVGGLRELVHSTSVRVAAHRLDAGVISGAAPKPGPYRSRFMSAIAAPVAGALGGKPVPVDIELEDGAVIPFAVEARAIHVPGHTQGSICLFLPDHKTIILGDAMQNKFGRKLSPPARAVTQDPDQALRSLRRLLDLDFETICFGHFPPIRTGGREAVENLLRDAGSAGDG